MRAIFHYFRSVTIDDRYLELPWKQELAISSTEFKNLPRMFLCEFNTIRKNLKNLVLYVHKQTILCCYAIERIPDLYEMK